MALVGNYDLPTEDQVTLVVAEKNLSAEPTDDREKICDIFQTLAKKVHLELKKDRIKYDRYARRLRISNKTVKGRQKIEVKLPNHVFSWNDYDADEIQIELLSTIVDFHFKWWDLMVLIDRFITGGTRKFLDELDVEEESYNDRSYNGYRKQTSNIASEQILYAHGPYKQQDQEQRQPKQQQQQQQQQQPIAGHSKKHEQPLPKPPKLAPRVQICKEQTATKATPTQPKSVKPNQAKPTSTKATPTMRSPFKPSPFKPILKKYPPKDTVTDSVPKCSILRQQHLLRRRMMSNQSPEPQPTKKQTTFEETIKTPYLMTNPPRPIGESTQSPGDTEDDIEIVYENVKKRKK